MTRFVRIDPTAAKVEVVEAEQWFDAAKTLKSAQVDFGTVIPGISIIVYEYGLVEGNGPYFTLGGQLYSGEAILFAYDEARDTIDMPPGMIHLIKPKWLKDKAEVEFAIKAGIVDRPQSAVNGAVIWRWS